MQEEPRNSSLATPFRRDASITCVAIDKDLLRTDLASKPIDDHRHCVAGVTEWRRWSCAVMGLFGTEKPLALHEI